MSTDQEKHPIVVNPGEKSISVPATRKPPEEPKPADHELFVTTAELEHPDFSILEKKRVLHGQGGALWQVRLSQNVVSRAPLQISRRLSKGFVRSKLKERTPTSSFRPEWIAHESRPKLVTPRNSFPLTARSRLSGSFTIESYQFGFPQIVTDAYPWCTIGKVYSGRDLNYGSPEKQGTGVLVGSDLMLTASHMVPWGEPGWYMRFDAASFDGGNIGRSYVVTAHGYESPDNGGDRAHDYALCTLYTPLGNRLGWMGTHGTTNESFYEDGRWTSVGYPGDTPRPQVAILVEVTDADGSDDGQEMSTDLVTPPGWSGGPLWGYIDDQPHVVGICSGKGENVWEWFSGDEHGIFAGGPDMVGLVTLAQLGEGLSGGIHASDPPLNFG